MSVEYFVGQELGDTGLWLRDGLNALVNLASGYTFTVKVWNSNGTAFTKADGITGAAGAGSEPAGTPNLVIQWDSTGELDQCTAKASYQLQVTARRTVDGKDRIWNVPLKIKAAAP